MATKYPYGPLSNPNQPIPPYTIMRRGTAYTIDQILFLGPYVLLYWSDPHSGIADYVYEYFLVAELALIVYHTICERLFGATVGKFLARLRVLTTDGATLTWRKALGRNLYRLLMLIPLFGGIILNLYYTFTMYFILGSDGQAPHDILPKTIVIQRPRKQWYVPRSELSHQ